MTEIDTTVMLQVGTVLHGTYRIYRIESFLSSGGFGNTYLAVYGSYKEKVAIKEFFMRNVNLREADGVSVSVDNSKQNAKTFPSQLQKFKKEAERLRQINNVYVVKVHDLFEENGTAYYVMDFVEGYDLESRLKQRGKPYTEKFVSNFLYRMLDALSAIHSTELLHLDLKPANIMVMPRGYIKLIDLGASKEYVAGKGATIFSDIAMTRAYAAPEQIDGAFNKLGPWTDFYALGSTLYRMLTNKVPPSISDLYEDKSEDKHVVLSMPNVSERMRHLVLWMMQLDRMRRPQKTSDIIEYLNSTKHFNSSTSNATYSRKNEQLQNSDDDTIVVEPPKLSVGKTILRFSEYEDSQYATIHTNQEWRVFCNSHWVNISKFCSSIRVVASNNYGTSERSCKIVVAAGNLVRTIDVVQKGMRAIEFPKQNSQNTPSNGSDEEFSFVGCFYIIVIISVVVYIIKIIMS